MENKWRGFRGGAIADVTKLPSYVEGDPFVISVAWLVDAPRRYGLGVFSAGFLMGALGMYIAAYLYGYRKS